VIDFLQGHKTTFAKSNHRSVKQSLCHALSLPPSLSLPSKLSTRCVAVSGSACYEGRAGGMCGGKGEQRLVPLIQLMKDLCSKSSCLPLSACKFPVCLISPLNAWVAREPGRKQTRRRLQKQARRKRKPNIKTLAGVLFLLFKTVVGVWLDHSLIINHEPIQTKCAVCR